MKKQTKHIKIEQGDDTAGKELEFQLLKTLSQLLPQSNNTSFVFTARDPLNSIIGGITASTSYGWLLVKVLWIDDSYRNQGLGTLLVKQAEEKAIELGCHSAWLDTSNPAAKNFYQNLDYQVFSQLGNLKGQYPERHKRWFMKKSLTRIDYV